MTPRTEAGRALLDSFRDTELAQPNRPDLPRIRLTFDRDDYATAIVAIENEAAADAVCVILEQHERVIAERDAARVKVARLREALDRTTDYARHGASCPADYSERPCDCGYAALMDETDTLINAHALRRTEPCCEHEPSEPAAWLDSPHRCTCDR